MSDNRRQDFRIDDVLPMRDELISNEEFEHQKSQLGIRSRQNSMLRSMIGRDVFASVNHDSMNPDLANAIETLDAKLNYLIGVNMLNDANRSDLQERTVNLSVTGASFHTDKPYRSHDCLKITMMLPSFPPMVLELIGEVTWAKPEKNGTLHIGVRFHFRCSEEEDNVAKYVFQRHREHLRLRLKDEGNIALN